MIDKLIILALEEDLGLGDITSDNIFTENDEALAEITAKEDMVICGMNIARDVFNYVDPSLKFTPLKKDGDTVKKGETVLKLDGKTLSILRGERTALNFMQRMSGIATASKEFSETGKKYGVMIVDTRKSLPGMRKLDKYAVRCGGAKNHRMSLSDSVLIKDNHIAAAGGIAKAVEKIRAAIGHTPKIEVETTNIDEVKEALSSKADIIMLDNMTPAQVTQALKVINKAAIAEVSGGVNKNNLEDYCKTGADVISMGALTHSVPSKDLSLKITGYKEI
ncbi:Nicotinate-nucleotide pyrophosphorylase [Elusimicrobium minutum Pei191]|uniref:Probable nicotinate-nucleotide pyrophosphorylase [carboxylating] n=1 Tax=Elusimicrobium minutum (strain Pei191) TaxID=445932 RepID=B2KBF5_ELUMP|nr:carboxylating nicotinate-nucleotide diphosphorylase [Elusimicrobium minutum]ACC97977.1 Nicotinate-nucleotide pyrophosphorylase [Elusimicrobium minutum Pei191]